LYVKHIASLAERTQAQSNSQECCSNGGCIGIIQAEQGQCRPNESNGL